MSTPANVPVISAKWVRRTRFIYDRASRFYDRGQHNMISLKRAAVHEMDLHRGDRVIAFCCGTGLEFPFIRDRIGPEGEILGIDWSEGMLLQAWRRISDNGWKNVELYRGDVSAIPESVLRASSYDAGICTLGLSMVSEPERAFQALKSAVRGGGRIVIGDVCSFTGLRSALNPISTVMDLIAGNTHRSPARSRAFAEELSSELLNTKLEWYQGGSYYVASGVRPEAAGA
ncbi:ubiquinone/menaquinone biosynthesis C-methylase UbiE [Nocardia sp. GAS34]